MLRSSCLAGLPWVTQGLIKRSLEAIASSDGISFSDVTYSVQTPSGEGFSEFGLFHQSADSTFGKASWRVSAGYEVAALNIKSAK